MKLVTVLVCVYFLRAYFQSYRVEHERSRVLSMEEDALTDHQLTPHQAAKVIPFDTSLVLFLSPESIVHQTEVLSYDFYDLIGNIGGFLGLLMGASILSLWDVATNRIKRIINIKLS